MILTINFLSYKFRETVDVLNFLAQHDAAHHTLITWTKSSAWKKLLVIFSSGGFPVSYLFSAFPLSVV